MEAAASTKLASAYAYARREPEKTALFQVVQRHLLTFEQDWTDQADGRTLPTFVSAEPHDFLGCGILGNLCGQQAGFNLHGATRVLANDQQGRLALCRCILRPPLANDRLKIVDDNLVRHDFKKPWADGTTSVDLPPLALLARLAALVPPPRRHLTGYFGVLSSHSSLRSQVVPVPAVVAPEEDDKPELPRSRYISWSELLKRTFEIDTVCPRCKTPLRLIAMIETEDTIKEILSAMGLPACAPQPWPARPPPSQSGGEGRESPS